MTARSDLAELLADGAGTVLLTQASTPTEARLIRERIAASGEDPADFAAYVARRATLALDRAEYQLLGPRYKPRAW